MIKTCRPLFLAITFFLLITSGFAQGGWDVSKAGLNDAVPADATIRVGTLKNGLRYYIRRNKEPEKRVEMRLAVNTGSVMENDDQQGLAHFTEHMAFNGTKHFKKNEVVDYLESIGMRFGADLNAYTSFDETVYMLQAPTDNPKYVEQGLQILEDWAHNVTFDDVEIDKERGVVIEEWRLGRGAQDRIEKKVIPVQLYKSVYAERLPIGKKEILESFKHTTVRQFYKDWYRPDLQAVLIVGDIDVDKMEAMVKKQFSSLENPASERPRTKIAIPDYTDTKIAIATDKEMPYSFVQLTYKHANMERDKVKDYRRDIVFNLFSSMVSNRLKEQSQQADPPFSFAGVGIEPYFRDKYALSAFAVVRPENIEKGLQSLLDENQRVLQSGFTQSELDREKKELLRGLESSNNERDKVESRSLVAEYIRNFLTGEPIPGIAAEYELHKRFLPDISLAEVNAVAKEWIKDGNNSVTITAPDKEGVKVPSEARVREILNQSKANKIAEYKDVVSDQPLMASKPHPGKVTSEKVIKEMGITEWQLSNRAKVVIKPTDFKNDEILFSAWAPGGTSLVHDKNIVSANNAAGIIDNSGIANFDATTLQKMLSGKVANASPTISELSEGFSGHAAPSDLETMMQLVNLYFTAPRIDETSYKSYKARTLSMVENNSLSPEGTFRDTVQKVISQNNFRRRPVDAKVLEEMNPDDAFRIYKERFSDAGNFTFFFVGNIDMQKLKPLVETYLASLPATGKKETWKDLHILPPKGRIEKVVRKGVEPKSIVQLVYTGPFTWSARNRFEADASMRVLSIMMRETMREDKGGVYGVFAGINPTRNPEERYSINIYFGCAPDNVDMLIKTAKEQIDILKKDGASEKNLQKVKETMHREHETSMRTNRYWMTILSQYYSNTENPLIAMEYDKIVDSINPETVKKVAEKYFDEKNYIQIVLKPESSN